MIEGPNKEYGIQDDIRILIPYKKRERDVELDLYHNFTVQTTELAWMKMKYPYMTL